MMPLQPGDFLSLLDIGIAYATRQRNRRDRHELIEIRNALKELKFSDETIKRLESIPSIEDTDLLIYEAGMASIKQRDTRKSVEAAFEKLEDFGRQEGLSIKAGRLLNQIKNAKFGIRHEIEFSYFNIIKNGSKAETTALTEKIRQLNELIEELDDGLGGVLLSER